jgi:hypothetical protein
MHNNKLCIKSSYCLIESGWLCLLDLKRKQGGGRLRTSGDEFFYNCNIHTNFIIFAVQTFSIHPLKL